MTIEHIARRKGALVVARGEDLGNGFCLVKSEWLPDKTFKVAKKHNLVSTNGLCIVSSEFIDRPWNATAVYSFDFQTEYTQVDL